ncbi:MAG: FUSC family protein [Hyphomicrobiales bacterium]|nr:MAG: FUSC family protein [Hyphomicrobiales bacterium]
MRRRDVARHVLHPHTLREGFALKPQHYLRNAGLAGLQAAIAAAVALPAIYLSPWSHLIGFAALGTLVALFGRYAPPRRRNWILLCCTLLQASAVFVMSTAIWLGASPSVQLALLALSCGAFFFVTVSTRFGPPGALIFVFAVGASMSPVPSFGVVMERTAVVIAVAALGWLVCALTETFRLQADDTRPFPAEPMRPLGSRVLASCGVILGAALAILTSHVLGAAYPAWAAMGALAVMQGAHLRISISRAVQRMAGTIVGAYLAWLVLTQEPSVWTLIAAIVALQFGTEVIIGANYGLGQILVTPMALFMTHLASPSPAGAGMALERVVDTFLGAAIGLALAVLFSSVTDRQVLARDADLRRKR